MSSHLTSNELNARMLKGVPIGHSSATSVVTPKVFALVKLLGAVVVAKAYRPQGEVYVCKKGKDGAQFMLPLEIDDFVEADVLWNDEDIGMMKILVETIDELQISGRVVPLTRDEAVRSGVPKRALKRLEKLGLVSVMVIPIVDYAGGEEGKYVGARSVVLFTSQGRAFVRLFINSQYGLEGRDEWERAKQWLAERSRFEESK